MEIKRAIGQHFFLQTAIRVGYKFYKTDKDKTSLELDLKYGFAFRAKIKIATFNNNSCFRYA